MEDEEQYINEIIQYLTRLDVLKAALAAMKVD